MLINGHTTSCGCSNSKGENIIKNILDDNKILYKEQKTFDDLKASSGVYFKFDFYLPEYNCCIEYDGIQHFEVWGWQTEEGLKKTQERDKIKDKYCKDNNIKLVRIPYTDFEKINCEYILERIS